MKTLTLLILMAAGVASAADFRIVNNVRVDLQPIHDWMQDHEGERPMKHWKRITILDFTPGGPWPTCRLGGEVSKTVYLQNIPPTAMQYWSQIGNLKTRVANLETQIADDKKRLRNAEAVNADYGSEFDQNRDRFAASLRNSEDDLERLHEQLAELQSQQKESISELAMFTGQVYAGKEVWDCGRKTQ